MDTIKQLAASQAAKQDTAKLVTGHKNAKRQARRYRRLSCLLIVAFWAAMLAAIWTERHLAFALTGVVLAALTVYAVGSCIMMGELGDAFWAELKKRDQVNHA